MKLGHVGEVLVYLDKIGKWSNVMGALKYLRNNRNK